MEEKKGLSIGDAIAVVGVWLCGLGGIWLVTTNYHGDQQVSYENAVGYIVIGVTVVTVVVLLRDLLADAIQKRLK